MKNKCGSEVIRRVVFGMAMAAMLVCGMAGCAGCNQDATIAFPTEIPLNGAVITPTQEESSFPTKTLPQTNTQTATDIPDETKELESKQPSLATPSPKPTSTPRPTPTAKPTPTNTPTPTPVIPEGMEPEYRFQMGDNVWYEYYENSTVLVVTGTGSTWDFDDYKVSLNQYGATSILEGSKTCSRMERLGLNSNAIPESWSYVADAEGPKKVIVQEGIIRLGRESLALLENAEYISLPSTLEEIGEYAFMETGTLDIEWVGLDFERTRAAKNAFLYSPKGNVEEILQYKEKPTPTPTPSPTPIPNPDKPRLAATLAISNNITYEFWDNGVMYVKGNGAIPNQPELWCLEEADDNPNGYTLVDKIHTVIIEEGITYLGRYCFFGIRNAVEWYLPKTCTGSYICTAGYGNVFYGYYNGKMVTITRSKDESDWKKYLEIGDFFKVLEDEEYAAKKDVTITWE